MGAAHHQVLMVLCCCRVFIQTDEPARKQAGSITVSLAATVERLLGLQAYLGVSLAVTLFPILARIIVELHRGFLVTAGGGRVAQKVSVRLFVVIIVQLHLARAKAATNRPFMEMLLLPAIIATKANERY